MRLIAKAGFLRLLVVLLAGLSIISVSELSYAAKIGERYGGGIVFYVDGSGQHGLIAANKDVSGHSPGKLEGDFTWYDAKIACENFVSEGFADWFLPNREQLNQLYQQRIAVGNFDENYYWSSTEQSSDIAWNQNFFVSDQYKYYKANVAQVRPVRVF